MLDFSQLAEYSYFYLSLIIDSCLNTSSIIKKKMLEPSDKSNTKSVVYDTYKWFK